MPFWWFDFFLFFYFFVVVFFGGVRTFLEKFPRLQNENMLVLTNLNLMKGWSNIVCGFFFIITSI